MVLCHPSNWVPGSLYPFPSLGSQSLCSINLLSFAPRGSLPFERDTGQWVATSAILGGQLSGYPLACGLELLILWEILASLWLGGWRLSVPCTFHRSISCLCISRRDCIPTQELLLPSDSPDSKGVLSSLDLRNRCITCDCWVTETWHDVKGNIVNWKVLSAIHIWLHSFICVCLHLYLARGRCVNMPVEARGTVPQNPPTLLFKIGYFAGTPSLQIPVLVGQRAPGIYLPVPTLQRGDYKWVTLLSFCLVLF